MISMFTLFISLFLAFVALALPPSPRAFLSRGEDQPSNHSLSIIPRRNNELSLDFAGAQLTAWTGGNVHQPINYLTVTLSIPPVKPQNEASYVTFAIVLGDATKPGCDIRLAGVQFNVTKGYVYAHPVRGNSLDNIKPIDDVKSDENGPIYPISVGDVITLKIQLGLAVDTMVVANRVRAWTASHTLTNTFTNPLCMFVARAIVLPTRFPDHSYGRLANFSRVDFWGFRYGHFRGSPGLLAPDLDEIIYFNLIHYESNSTLAVTSKGEGLGAFSVKYFLPV